MRARELLYAAAALLLTACSGMKDIPEDALLLHRVKVITSPDVPEASEPHDIKPALLKPYVLQREQTRWFGLVRQPVAFDTLLAQKSCESLRSALFNKGYLQARVDYVTVPLSKRKIDVIYGLHPGLPYSLNHVSYEIEDPQVERFLNAQGALEVPAGVIGRQFSVEWLDQ